MGPLPNSHHHNHQQRVVLHFDYDCFYAQVVQNRTPASAAALAGRPVGVTQKNILATCNYVARSRGVRKLMRIAEAKRTCPDLVLVNGEDLSPFRDASKQLHRLVSGVVGAANPVERLGLDEVFVDASQLIAYNLSRLSRGEGNEIGRRSRDAFFRLDEHDSSQGFHFDARTISGCVLGDHDLDNEEEDEDEDEDESRKNSQFALLLGSHLAAHLRRHLLSVAGYTASAGIATNKMLAKLAGKQNKPDNQTVCLDDPLSIQMFMDGLPLRSVPGIGFRTTHLLEAYFAKQMTTTTTTSTTETTENGDVTVGHIRGLPGLSVRILDDIMASAGPGTSNIPSGSLVWELLHGRDEDRPVRPAASAPSQISIEDTYGTGSRRRLLPPTAAALPALTIELERLARALLRRMRLDLTEDGRETAWIVRPKTLRLTIRPQLLEEPEEDDEKEDNDSFYHFSRMSRSQPLPGFVLNLSASLAQLATRLTSSALLPMFRHLAASVPVRGGRHAHKPWTVGLLNVCVAQMAPVAGAADDIAALFRRGQQQQPYTVQEDPVEDVDMHKDIDSEGDEVDHFDDDEDDEDDDDDMGWGTEACSKCGRFLPLFAKAAHARYHLLGD